MSGRRRTFGSTWWGRAWVDALEESAVLDPNRLGRGRTYARSGAVHQLEVTTGVATARVRGSHGRYYRTDVAVRPLAAQEWEQVADAIAARAAHAAALLDGELSPGIVEDVAALDIRLLPGPGDLRPDCSCLDWAEPCKHAAAVCYLLADELDRDPFVLFSLRGVDPGVFMEMVRSRRRGVDGDPVPLGVDPAELFAQRPLEADLGPPPDHLRPPRRPGLPGPWAIDERAGLRPDVLVGLARDAAARAWSALVDGDPCGLSYGRYADLARRAAAMSRGEAAMLAARLGVRPAELVAWARSFEMGGDAGVEMVADPDRWCTDQELLEEGRRQLVELGYARRSVALNYDSLRLRGNTWVALGPDRRWYRMVEKGKDRALTLVAPPSADIGDVVDPPT